MVMVMEECLPCLFKSLCSYVFHVYNFSFEIREVGIMLYSFWEEETYGIMGCELKKLMWYWLCFMSLSHVC